MIHINSEQLSHRFLVLGVVAAAVLPRQPSDTRWGVGGGNLTRSFRKLLLAIVFINFCRLGLNGKKQEVSSASVFSDLLGVVEVMGLTFLCYLLPYVIQKNLSSIINIGGRPGYNLTPSLMVVSLLSFVGVVFSRTIHPNFWSFKKLANAVSSLPVLKTLRLYNSVMVQDATGRTNSGSRGPMLSQIVIIIEYWHMIVQMCCVLGHLFDRRNPTSEDTVMDAILRAARATAFSADWTRVLAHSIFLNILDEFNHLPGNGNMPSTDRSEERESESQAMVSLVPRARHSRI